MKTVLRGALVRWVPLTSLIALTAIVTAGVLTVLGFAEASGASPWLVLPLGLLGMVALPELGRELGMARRHEIALARLRGLVGVRLAVVLLLEPALALVLGIGLGVAFGTGLTWLLTEQWLGTSESGWGRAGVIGTAAVLAGGLAGIGAGITTGVNQPLGDVLRQPNRPKAAGVAETFFNIAVFLGAGLAIYRSHSGGGLDMVVLAGPVLIGLAVGRFAIWLMAVLARAATKVNLGQGLPSYLAFRRMARSADSAGALRLLVASGALAVVAITAMAGGLSWSAQTARLNAGAPIQVTFDELGAHDAWRLTRQVDPGGRELMAAVRVADETGKDRRVFFDLARSRAVIGDFLDATPAGDALLDAEELLGRSNDLVRGNQFAMTVRAPMLWRQSGQVIEARIGYIADTGEPTETAVVLRPRRAPGVLAGATRVQCANGCTVTEVTLTRGANWRGEFLSLGRSQADLRPVRVVVEELRINSADLGSQAWRQGDGFGSATVPVLRSAQGIELVLSPPTGSVTMTAAVQYPDVPVVAAGPAFRSERQRLQTAGGDDRPAEVVDRVAALPLIGTEGLLADLPTTLRGASPTIPAAEVMVLASDQTSPATLAKLREAGGVVHRLDDIKRAGEQAGGVIRTRIYALVAGCCLLVAMLSLLSSAGRQRAAYHHDVATLRLLGLSRAQIGAAGRRELVLLSAVAVVAGLGGGLLAASLLVDNLPLLDIPPFALSLRAADNLVPALGVGGVLGVVALAAAWRARQVSPQASTPARLREGGS